ncbi:hypothetical protein Q2T40_16090 [Winogradskyella maritima]|uniref:HTH araC/xylS-type domain-containing protein n=1 Tax=Winogradskyella maritima TaxID=1517766 RepID=A0ABV8AIN1_9FLAO|nr:hypothetical protein [Winogradskyella maritima]
MQHHIICPKTGGLFFLSDFKNKDYEGLLTSSALYKIIYNRGNAVKIYVDHKLITLKKDEVLFCKPLNTVQVSKPHDTVNVVAYNKDFYKLSNAAEEASFYWFWYFGVNHPHIFQLSEVEQGFFQMMYECMEREFNQYNGCIETVRDVLKRVMAVSIMRVEDSPIVPSIGETQLHIIKKFSLLIEEHFRKKIAFTDIPKLLKRNPSYVSKLLTKYFGKRAVKTAKEKFILESKQAGARIEKRMEIQYPSRLNTLSEAEHQIQ